MGNSLSRGFSEKLKNLVSKADFPSVVSTAVKNAPKIELLGGENMSNKNLMGYESVRAPPFPDVSTEYNRTQSTKTGGLMMENKMTYQKAKKMVKVCAGWQDHDIKEKRNHTGRIGYMIVDLLTDKIVAGEGYALSLQDCCRLYGVEPPDEA